MGRMYGLMVEVIVPRPIAWVSTMSAAGLVNLAPFSFFSGVAAHPPTVMVSVVNRRDGSQKDTVRNLHEVPELVINVVSYEQRELMNATSEELPPDVSEPLACGVDMQPSERVRPPRVRGSRAHLECQLERIVPVGEGPFAAHALFARVVLVHVDDALVEPGGKVRGAALDAIGRMGGDVYARTTDRFALPRPVSKPG